MPDYNLSTDETFELSGKSTQIELPWGIENFKLYVRDSSENLFYVKFFKQFYEYKTHDRLLKACPFGCPGPIGVLRLYRNIGLHLRKHGDKDFTEAQNLSSEATKAKWKQLFKEDLARQPASSTGGFYRE